MPTRTSYKQGTPSWADLQTTDTEGAKAFYSALFGWTYDDQPLPDDAGVYSMGWHGGQTVAAIAPQSPMLIENNVPPLWNTYIAVDDVDAVTAAAVEAGGQVLLEPFDIEPAGRMSFVTDPSGVAVGLWQAKGHIGAGIVNEPGAVIWNELTSSDLAAALPFYEKTLGVTTKAASAEFGEYTMIYVGDDAIAGAMAPMMEGAPNHWHVYFAVANAEESLATATAAGATVLSPIVDTPVGKLAVIRDPQGAVFSIMEAAPGTVEG